MTAVILMKNWSISMTSTPQRPECAANTTFSRPTASSVCQRSKPNSTAAIFTVETEQHGGDLHGGEVDGGHDHAVEEETEIDGAEAAHGAGGLSGVAHFVEFQVGEDAGTPPEARVEENRGDAGEGECPPLPVAGDSLGADEVGHQVGCVTREGGGHHGETGEPPGHGAPGGEEFGSALAGALPEEESGNEADKNGSGGDDPINCVEVH